MKTIKITHLTSVHPRYDPRIFIKECGTLSKVENYNVSFIVADGLGDEIKNEIPIYDVGTEVGRINRMFKTTTKVLNKAIELDSDIYHLHDPELMPIGIKLKKLGKKIIFDAHEDIPKQIKIKTYLPNIVKKPLAYSVEKYEEYACKKFDFVITSTPYIRDKFLKYTKSLDIRNYAIINEISNNINWEDRNDQVCYVGVISRVRGISENVKALKYVDNEISFKLGGMFNNSFFKEELEELSEWKRVNFIGKLNREEVKSLLAESKVGLVTLHPADNFVDALPVKMFEYMLSGIPVIASNFPILKDIVENSNCGICVNPEDDKEIGEAIQYLFDNQDIAKKMGELGKKAVIENYNWQSEEEKLLNIYSEVIND